MRRSRHHRHVVREGIGLRGLAADRGALSANAPPRISTTSRGTISTPSRWATADSVGLYSTTTPPSSTPPSRLHGQHAARKHARKRLRRVIYSDFTSQLRRLQRHVPGECVTVGMTAQEKVLEFMFFDLASCVGPAPSRRRRLPAAGASRHPPPLRRRLGRRRPFAAAAPFAAATAPSAGASAATPPPDRPPLPDVQSACPWRMCRTTADCVRAKATASTDLQRSSPSKIAWAARMGAGRSRRAGLILRVVPSTAQSKSRRRHGRILWCVPRRTRRSASDRRRRVHAHGRPLGHEHHVKTPFSRTLTRTSARARMASAGS